MSLTKVHNRLIQGSIGNAIDFGLSESASGTVNSAAINAALSSYDHVFIPSGGYDVEEMITIGNRKTVELSSNVVIRRPATSTNDDPIFWLNENNGALLGYANSRVLSLVAPVNGVVRIGSASMTTDTQNALKNVVKGLAIGGHQSAGNATGDHTVALLIQNPSFSFNSYFNVINDIQVFNVNYGIELRHQANANFISNIQSERTGDNTNTTGGACVWINGGQENSINNVFVHVASNTYGILVSDSDNTANGGNIMRPRYNKVVNFIAEPGGASARTLVVTSTSATDNLFLIGENTPSGNILPTDFYTNNNVQIDQYMTAERVAINRLQYLDGGDLTISSGEITVTHSKHLIDTEGAAASDDLDTINGGINGQTLILQPVNSSRSVVVKDGTGNLRLNGDFTLDHTQDSMVLIYSNPNWVELARSDNNT